MKKNNLARFVKALTIVAILICLCECFCNNTYAISDSDVKVSIIVPVYKVEPWIDECIKSLINQTLKEIEIICIDDGSPDNCGKILDEYAKIDDRIIVIHQTNQGLSCARNAGIDIAKGEYLAFVDSDDYVKLDLYEHTYNIAHNNQDDVLEFGVTVVPDNLHFEFITYNKQIEITDASQLKKLIDNYYVWNKLYRTSMIKENNIKFIPKMVYEDNAFTLMMMPYIKKYQSIVEKFYCYRRRYGSITAAGRRYKGLDNCIMAIPAVCQEWRKQNVLKGNEDYILSILVKKYYYLLEAYAENNPYFARQILNSFGDDIYNTDVLGKCNVYTRKSLRKLEWLSAKLP